MLLDYEVQELKDKLAFLEQQEADREVKKTKWGTHTFPTMSAPSDTASDADDCTLLRRQLAEEKTKAVRQKEGD